MALYERLLTAPNVGFYVQNNPIYQMPYALEALAPEVKRQSRIMSSVFMDSVAPTLLSLLALNADSIPRARGSFEIKRLEMPYFKNHYERNEQVYDEITRVNESNDLMVQEAARILYDDAGHLFADAELTKEFMRAKIYTEGKLAIASNGQAYAYDFGVPDGHKVKPTVKWNLTTADPVKDLRKWKRQMELERGVTLDEMWINGATIEHIANTDAVKNAMYVFAQGKVTPDDTEVVSFLERKLQMTIYVYNKGYKDGNTFKPFIADGTVLLKPLGQLGKTYMGLTPEEQGKIDGNKELTDVYLVKNVAFATWESAEPVMKCLKATMSCLPSFDRAKDVIIASVL